MRVKYHRTTTNGREKWLYKSPPKQAGVPEAVVDYKRWCNDGKAPLNESLSYQMMLRSLPMNDSLILEAVRALRDNIPMMVQSAKVCAEIEAEEGADETTPRVGGCSNLLLDDFTGDYRGAYEQ